MTAQLGREQLLEIVETDHVQCGDASAMARMLLSGMDSEPVAWTSDNALSGVAVDMCGMLGPKNAVGDIALYTAPPAPVEITPTAEQRRVIEMLLSVCGAAFELADDACEAEIDGEAYLTVPPEAFHKLSDALDEIEETLPTEDPDRPDVFLAWSAMPRAALKSLLHAAPAAPEQEV